MYNIHSHYENIYALAKTIIADPRVLYLHPFGSTQPENIEVLAQDRSNDPGPRGPLIICYDQEPVNAVFNRNLFEHIKNNFRGPYILLTTEKNSPDVDAIAEEFGFTVCYYFHHIFAAADWYRGYPYCYDIMPPKQREIKKKYITFNRITSNARAYRSLFVSELVHQELLEHGHVSYSDICPDTGHNYRQGLNNLVSQGLVEQHRADTAIDMLDHLNHPLRIDFANESAIPNQSFVLSALPQCNESFLHVVTETVYWSNKHHLTEKIFKPIALRQPFVLLGPAGNLAYLKSYGFKTFDRWIDESYDSIEDPVKRLDAVVKVLQRICYYSNNDLSGLLHAMEEVLDYNYNLFYSKEFIERSWQELEVNLRQSISQSQHQN